MNIKFVVLLAMALCCLGFCVPSLAGQKLDAVNVKVAQQSDELDAKYGVLLDYQERNDLKLDLIAKQVLIDAIEDISVQDLAQAAFKTYEISDPYEQRKLLIKIESQTVQRGTGSSGNEIEFP